MHTLCSDPMTLILHITCQLCRSRSTPSTISVPSPPFTCPHQLPHRSPALTCHPTTLHLPSPAASPFTCSHPLPHLTSPALTRRPTSLHLPSPVAPPPFPCPHLLRQVVVDVHVPLAVRAEQVVDVSGPLSQTATAIATAAAIVIVIASAAPFLLLHLSGRRTAIGLQGGREGGERMSVRNERRMRRCGSNPRGVGKEGMAWHAGRR